jgi:hypothetical protein
VIAVEFGILILLAMPRARIAGAVVGTLFHFGLGWAHFFDFSTYVFALYVLLLPGWTHATARDDATIRLAIVGWLLYGVVTLAAWSAGNQIGPLGLHWYTVRMLAWCVAALPLVGRAISLAWRRSAPNVVWASKATPRWLFVVPLIAFLNGCTPYLGIRTVANYSMFSNLRVEEARTNHLLPAVLQLQTTDWMRDVVEVYAFEIPPVLDPAWPHQKYRMRRQFRWLAEPRPPVRVPWLELRRLVRFTIDAGSNGVRVRYRRAGVLRDVPDATVDPELAAPLAWPIRKLVAFRAIEPNGRPVRCRW